MALKLSATCKHGIVRQYKLVDLDYGFTYPKFLDLEKTFIFLNHLFLTAF